MLRPSCDASPEKNTQHPTYKALSELRKAVKTAVLARYLADQAQRREIDDGLNVVKQWNSANDFTSFVRLGEHPHGPAGARQTQVEGSRLNT